VKVLYVASDQVVPGTTGGSVHVLEVARGLTRRGHAVDVVVRGDSAEVALPDAPGVRWHPVAWWPPHRFFRFRARRAVAAVAEGARPDVIIERYYNFGGEGIGAAASLGALGVLEVNAPVIDYPGSNKRLIDRALVVEPMRKWRERTCNLSDLIVTPSAAILPPRTPPRKVLELEWGADTDRFRPGVPGPIPFMRPAATVAVFAGAFRSWHGAVHLAVALRELHARGRRDIGAVFIGDGPELPRVRQAAEGLEGIVFTGALPHAQMPACLAACDIGVAPFDIRAHRALALGFYWSPLKIFEYMAAGLPVVAPAADRLPSLVGHEREGLLYAPDASGALASALERLTDARLRADLGSAARTRAVRDYSWQAHCRALEAGITSIRTSDS
jgi:glycosyltransferase involved in cell wall biosynthesis